PLLDRHGDPLPEGAIARLGTLRWRADSGVDALAYSSDGKTLVAISGNKVCLFDTTTGKLTKAFQVAASSIGRVALSPDSKQLLGCTTSAKFGERVKRAMQIWELRDGGKALEEDAENVCWIGWSAGGQPLALSLVEGAVLLRELATGKERRFESQH